MKKTYLAVSLLAALGISCAHHKHSAHHAHMHGPQCGHTAIVHDGHTDYLDGGHLHSSHGGHVDEHALAVAGSNPDQCTPNHACTAHPKGHAHGAACGHEAVPHGDHSDYLVGGHLHHGHAGHCDDHGPVQLPAK